MSPPAVIRSWIALLKIVTTMVLVSSAVDPARATTSVTPPERVTASPADRAHLVEVGTWVDPAVPSRASIEPVPGTSCLRKQPRATIDRPDTIEDHQVHIVYLVPSDMADEKLDSSGVLACSVEAWNDWFRKQSGGASWRIDTLDPPGRRSGIIDITFVKSPRPSSEIQSNADVTAELKAAGLLPADESGVKKFLVYAATDTGRLCGAASYPLSQLDPAPLPLGGGHSLVASVFLFSDAGCGAHSFGTPGNASYSEAIAMQELLHTEGVVPLGAPHGCSAVDLVPVHACTPGLVFTDVIGQRLDPQRRDVMFPFAGPPLSENILDIDRDDYFDHPFPFRDLADSDWLTRS